MYDLFLEAAKIIHYPLTFFILMALVFVAAFFISKNRTAMILTLLFSVVFAVPFAKEFFKQGRPCSEASPAIGVECPGDYAFPSGHTNIAFAIAFATLQTQFFPIFLAIAGIVGYSRIFLNVHTLHQVVAGIAISFATYMLFWELTFKLKKKIKEFRELQESIDK